MSQHNENNSLSVRGFQAKKVEIYTVAIIKRFDSGLSLTHLHLNDETSSETKHTL